MKISRSGWALTTLAGVSVLMLGPGLGAQVGDLSGRSLPAALVAAGSLVQVSISAWVLLAVALHLVGRSSRLATALTPAVLRRVVFVGASGAIGAMALTPAHAERVAAPAEHGRHTLDGLRLPDRPSSTATPTAEPASSPTAGRRPDRHEPADPGTIVVRHGDTLWALAARALPDDAPDADVARATTAWHATNRAVIGADPDLIIPGQRLTPPRGKDRS